jgi:hypothetical protein
MGFVALFASLQLLVLTWKLGFAAPEPPLVAEPAAELAVVFDPELLALLVHAAKNIAETTITPTAAYLRLTAI